MRSYVVVKVRIRTEVLPNGKKKEVRESIVLTDPISFGEASRKAQEYMAIDTWGRYMIERNKSES